MTPTLVFRVHTDLRLGLGHVVRALVLDRAWRALGGRSILAVSGGPQARRLAQGLHPFRQEPLGIEVVDLGEDLHAPLPEELKVRASLALVDQWEATPEQVRALRPLKVALLEDDGEAHESADLLFQPFLEGVDWPATPVKVVNGRKVRPCETFAGSCRVLRGASFIVVGEAATELRPKREPLQPLTVRRLLATFGGTDGPGLAQKAHGILGTLLREGRWSGSCTLVAPQGVVGPAVPGCTVVPQLPELTRRLPEFDAVWCAAGLTLAEAICLGVPAAAWGQNARQAGMIGDLALANACVNLGEGPEADPRLVEEALAHWFSPEGQESRQEQVRDGLKLVDGSGAARIAQELWALAGA